MKLLCADEHMPLLVEALARDKVPAVLMERTGPGWHVEFLRPAGECGAVMALIDSGTVERR
jgi:hypothetical protein